MPAAPDTSDLRALARVILDREDLDQSAMRASVRPYELAPVRRRVLEGARVGLLAGVGLGLASVGSGTARSFQPPQWAMYFGLFIVMTIAIGAAVGAGAGLVVHSVQRRRLDRELVQLTDPVDGSLRDRGEQRGDPSVR